MAENELDAAGRIQASRRTERAHTGTQQWREEFPYHWRADDVITRRDTLRFLFAGTGALALATGALAFAGNLRSTAAVTPLAVARVGELGPNQWKVFTFPDQYTQCILINVPGAGLVAYNDACTHLSCAVLYNASDRNLHCPCHDGLFDGATGNVLAGPPARPLVLVQLQQHGDTIYVVGLVQR